LHTLEAQCKYARKLAQCKYARKLAQCKYARKLTQCKYARKLAQCKYARKLAQCKYARKLAAASVAAGDCWRGPRKWQRQGWKCVHCTTVPKSSATTRHRLLVNICPDAQSSALCQKKLNVFKCLSVQVSECPSGSQVAPSVGLRQRPVLLTVDCILLESVPDLDGAKQR
jgi:hypothetical protein